MMNSDLNILYLCIYIPSAGKAPQGGMHPYFKKRKQRHILKTFLAIYFEFVAYFTIELLRELFYKFSHMQSWYKAKSFMNVYLISNKLCRVYLFQFMKNSFCIRIKKNHFFQTKFRLIIICTILVTFFLKLG